MVEKKRAAGLWEEKAKQNARYFVNQKTKSGELVDESELQETGHEDYDRHIASDPILSDLIKKRGKSMTALDIGSGIGRMSESFARDLATVHGIDISPTMVDIAKRRLSGLSNVTFTVNDGESIPFAPATFDLVFSYLVFQHVDSVPAIERYLKEIYRTLKPGGVAKIQLRTGPGVRRWVWSYGASFTPEEAAQLAQGVGLRILENKIDDPKSLWITLVRE
jgi:ubiquinone/menaquinone biosynthesis C-methylase UbiE